MKTLLLMIGMIATQNLAQSQEHTGHGRHSHAQQQQQQQQAAFKREVIHDEEAEKLFTQLSQNGKYADNIAYRCSAAVLHAGRPEMTECFDRGVEFKRASRFKCYVADTNKMASSVGAMLFDLLHNSCGGDGIKPKQQH